MLAPALAIVWGIEKGMFWRGHWIRGYALHLLGTFRSSSCLPQHWRKNIGESLDYGGRADGSGVDQHPQYAQLVQGSELPSLRDV
ncbi:hypothetical protein GMOD_00003648 [Pyrenophora seminiperda CCB06]|uniref:Uncharacterized protein n=1 Tax=Pyrenophora seminiperda CCB06 TaxID=1302712 RepID=A0A3M7MK59_9PLEO|nr:hypothetical protein GMOD_00003648 [Pyrenophora seminiperda CCB06]